MRITNDWAKNITETEVSNWIDAMVEIGRTEPAPRYGDGKGTMIRCPFFTPLAIIY